MVYEQYVYLHFLVAFSTLSFDRFASGGTPHHISLCPSFAVLSFISSSGSSFPYCAGRKYHECPYCNIFRMTWTTHQVMTRWCLPESSHQYLAAYRDNCPTITCPYFHPEHQNSVVQQPGQFHLNHLDTERKTLCDCHQRKKDDGGVLLP
jgi:hypothetical protein